MVAFRALQTRNKNYLPWQAPPLLLWGVPKPRRGLYALCFSHAFKNFDRYHHLIERWARVGCFKKSIGVSNRPTLTGKDELIFVSPQHKGGRGIRIGDMVSITGLEVKGPPGEISRLVCNKRIVGLPGDQQYSYEPDFPFRRQATTVRPSSHILIIHV